MLPIESMIFTLQVMAKLKAVKMADTGVGNILSCTKVVCNFLNAYRVFGRLLQVLEKDEEIAELQRRLTSLISLVETYQETLPVSPRPTAFRN